MPKLSIILEKGETNRFIYDFVNHTAIVKFDEREDLIDSFQKLNKDFKKRNFFRDMNGGFNYGTIANL